MHSQARIPRQRTHSRGNCGRQTSGFAERGSGWWPAATAPSEPDRQKEKTVKDPIETNRSAGPRPVGSAPFHAALAHSDSSPDCLFPPNRPAVGCALLSSTSSSVLPDYTSPSPVLPEPPFPPFFLTTPLILLTPPPRPFSRPCFPPSPPPSSLAAATRAPTSLL